MVDLTRPAIESGSIAGVLFAEAALLPTGWARDVLLKWDISGRLVSVEQNATPLNAGRSTGLILPGMPNLHSHAFQRAMAGLTEYRANSQDSFWSWRDLMYRFAGFITPEQLEAIATGLYVEMLEAGYTSVCEFHYVHHQGNGLPYADDREMAMRLLCAARKAGIGLTLLPVLYQASGFGATAPSPDQRRFIRGTDNMLALLESLKPLCEAQGARLGLAPHSLRAVPPESLRDAISGLTTLDAAAPIHIHIAEQLAEVDACLQWSGQRPVQWLFDRYPVDQRWCLVHATHMSREETVLAASSGAVAGLCPSTEANLGDGIFDAALWRANQGKWGVGSDSHVTVNAADELRLLEYSQRLLTGQRNVLAGPTAQAVATSMTLEAVAGGAQASGRPIAGLAPGQQADWVVLDSDHPLLAGLPSAEAMLSAHIFASHRQSAITEVWVAGQPRVRFGQHSLAEPARAALNAARTQLINATQS